MAAANAAVADTTNTIAINENSFTCMVPYFEPARNSPPGKSSNSKGGWEECETTKLRYLLWDWSVMLAQCINWTVTGLSNGKGELRETEVTELMSCVPSGNTNCPAHNPLAVTS